MTPAQPREQKRTTAARQSGGVASTKSGSTATKGATTVRRSSGRTKQQAGVHTHMTAVRSNALLSQRQQ